MVQALRDVRDLRFAWRSIPFCAETAGDDAISGTFVHHPAPSSLTNTSAAMTEWVVVRVRPASLVDDMASVAIAKFTDRAALAAANSVQVQALGEDVVYGALSISALPNSLLVERGVDSRRILLRNSFKLVQHRELSGATRTLLAWFVHRTRDDGVDVNAGFLPVDIGVASYTVRDVKTGLEFHSDNLVDFIAGLERVSGNRLRPDADQLAAATGTLRTEASVHALEADNLFLRLEACQADDVSVSARQRSDMDFFDAQPFTPPDGGAGGWLYHNSFAFKNNWLMFRDAAGQMGTLRFQTMADDPRQLTLVGHGDHEAAFIHAHGLQPGQRYTAQGIREILQDHDLVWLPADDGEAVRPTPGVQMFQLRVPETQAIAE